MKSPFPGMDPYLESHWRDVHARLVLYACDQLEEHLPQSLFVRVEERIVFETEDATPGHRYPDVRVTEISGPVAAGGTALAVQEAVEIEPIIVEIDSEPMTETFLEIRDVAGRNVVTVIELLSKVNKTAGDGLTQYRTKQAELRAGGVNLVEIDLLREGRRDLLWPVSRFPRQAATPYLACVRRAKKPTYLEVYPMPLRQRLPKIRVPLREQDADASLDLQPLLDQAYRKGRYADTLDYRVPPTPPLEEPDAAWVRELLESK